MTTTTEQCTCGHAAEWHGDNGTCGVGPPCSCTEYESWITPEMELANARRVSGDNAALFAIANKAVEEMRALVGEWRKEFKRVNEDIPYTDTTSYWGAWGMNEGADELEAVVVKYDAAIKEQIK